jgi:hypothetical protein
MVVVGGFVLLLAAWMPIRAFQTHTTTYHVNAVLPPAPSKPDYPYGVQTRSGLVWYFQHPTGLVPGDVLLVRYNGLNQQLGTTIHGLYTPTAPQPSKVGPLVFGLILAGAGVLAMSSARWLSRMPRWLDEAEAARQADRSAAPLRASGQYLRTWLPNRLVRRSLAATGRAAFAITIREAIAVGDAEQEVWFAVPLTRLSDFQEFERGLTRSRSQHISVSYLPNTRLVTTIAAAGGSVFDAGPLKSV